MKEVKGLIDRVSRMAAFQLQAAILVGALILETACLRCPPGTVGTGQRCD